MYRSEWIFHYFCTLFSVEWNFSETRSKPENGIGPIATHIEQAHIWTPLHQWFGEKFGYKLQKEINFKITQNHRGTPFVSKTDFCTNTNVWDQVAKTRTQFSHRISKNFKCKLLQKCIYPASYRVYGIYACDRFRKLEIQTKYCVWNVIPAGEDIPWVPEVHTLPIQTAGRRLAKQADYTKRRLAKRADCTERTMWAECWSRVTSGSNRQKSHFHVNVTFLWSRLILVSDQTGFPMWEVK